MLTLIKKYFLLILLLSPLHALSQASLGIKAGGGLSMLNASIASHYDYNWEAGFFSKADFSDFISLQPEFDYGSKGSKITYNENNYLLRFNYASARFIGLFSFSERWQAGAGPYFSYLVSVKQSPEIVKKDFFSKFAVGINPSVQYESTFLILAVRYDWGLTLITMDALPEAKNNPLHGSRFSGFSIVAGIKF